MIMKRLTTVLTSVAVMLGMVSCNKDYISPEELFKDGSKVAKTKIHTKSDKYEDTVTGFRQIAVYRNSDEEGKSWLIAFSGGKMVYDAFMLSIYFDSIDNLRVGDKLNISRFLFSFFFSSNSAATTDSYEGTITLADKGDDYVILRFDKVRFSCSYGSYNTDGYLYCPLFEEYGQ